MDIANSFRDNLLVEDRYRMMRGTPVLVLLMLMYYVFMTRASDLIRSRTFDAFFPLLLTAILNFSGSRAHRYAACPA